MFCVKICNIESSTISNFWILIDSGYSLLSPEIPVSCQGILTSFLFYMQLIIAFMAALLSISLSSTGTSVGKIRGTGLQVAKGIINYYRYEQLKYSVSLE